MWLLDVNLPNGLARLLHRYGIACDTTARRGWRELTNGALAEAACREGFRVILTRDRLFLKSAGRPMVVLPELAIVIMTLPQAREAALPCGVRGAMGREVDPAGHRGHHRVALNVAFALLVSRSSS